MNLFVNRNNIIVKVTENYHFLDSKNNMCECCSDEGDIVVSDDNEKFPIIEKDIGNHTNAVTIIRDKAIPKDYQDNKFRLLDSGGIIPISLTYSEQRRDKYDELSIIPINGKLYTITEASQQWKYYMAEGNEGIGNEIMTKIQEAKSQIRKLG